MPATASKGKAVVTLPSPTEVLVTREFNAPKHLVYRAWTTPELVSRWWTAKLGSMKSTEIDLRVGGKWRWVMMTDRDFEVGFHGEYKEIVPNERLVFTEIFEGMPEAGAVTTVSLTEKDGRTIVTVLTQHEKPEHRDAHINSGMESGMQVAFDLLEEVAISLAA